MFPGFIIEQIRQREEEEKTIPQLELPVPAREGAPASDPDEEPDRGVVIIDLVSD